MLWYPSIGSKGYPYSLWETRRWDTSLSLLAVLEEYYEDICSFLRRMYKWSPAEMDEMPLSRLLKIYEEAVEENDKKRDSLEDLINYRGMV